VTILKESTESVADQLVTVDSIKSDVLPALFKNSAAIAEYCGLDANVSEIDSFSRLMEQGAVSALAAKISEIVSALADADPQKIAKKPSWIQRMLGGGLETRVRYQVARKSLDSSLVDAEVYAQRVRDTLVEVDKLLNSHAAQAARLEMFIRAGREYLNEHPQAGLAEAGQPRDAAVIPRNERDADEAYAGSGARHAGSVR
jgi:hypothetical protein